MNRALPFTLMMLAVAGMSLLTVLSASPALAQAQAAGNEVTLNAPPPEVVPDTAGTENPNVEVVPAGTVTVLGPPTVQEADAPVAEAGGIEAPILDGNSLRLSVQVLLKDGGGIPLVGPVNLKFRIWDAAAAGAVVQGPINLAGVPLTNGVADVQVPVTNNLNDFDGSGRWLSVAVGAGPQLTPRIPLTSVAYAMRVDRVESEELADDIELGNVAAHGFLSLWSNTDNLKSIVLDGQQHRIATFGNNGNERVRLWGPIWGETLLFDEGGDQTVKLSAGPTIGFGGTPFGGQLWLRDAAGANTISLIGDIVGGTGKINSTGTVNVVDTIGGTTLGKLESFSFGARLDTFDEAGALTVQIGSTFIGGFATFFQGDGTSGVLVDGDSGGAGYIAVDQNDGGSGVIIDGSNGTDGGGDVTVYQADGSTGVFLDGDATDANGGALVEVRDNVSQTRVRLDGESIGTGGEISVMDNDGTETVEILGAESSTTGAQIALRKADGTTTITLDADFFGDGRIITQELQVTGGSDLSENFDIDAGRGAAKPGMVVCIDPDRVGKLRVSGAAYDRTVAGIISGAGDVKPGMLMGQRGTIANGEHPVALTGRVYCFVDASNGAIEPGDLLTTSDVPGHAMKVTDHAKAQGAILGKAMSSLTEGKGLVLVLVTLQ